MKRNIYIAVPMLDELSGVDRFLQQLRAQTLHSFRLVCCVNQPDDWWQMPVGSDEHRVCRENQMLLSRLREEHVLDIDLIDCSSPGCGWHGKRRGVGWARKMCFDKILAQCADGDLIVSLDADTGFDALYLQSLAETFDATEKRQVLAVPYYHDLVHDDASDEPNRRILRYECYMRYYYSQLRRIGSPYAFTALGSAMAFTAGAYKRVGGITPMLAGEDFYLMQKFAKTTGFMTRGCGANAAHAVVHPSARISGRVPFGTGPAMMLTLCEMDERYPFYASEAFDEIADTYKAFAELYRHDIETPLSEFLRNTLRTDDLWGALRKNFKREELFVHACHERLDGLRILQYLRQSAHPHHIPSYEGRAIGFASDSIQRLDAYRNSLRCL